MSILTPSMRNEFIGGLKAKYTKNLPIKSIVNRDDIMYAATNLYAYGTPFVNLGRSRQPHYGPSDIPHLTHILDPWVTRICNYFMSPYPRTQGDFNKIHSCLCHEFLQIFITDGKYSHTYGSAQKMTNVLFKYLSCFSDAVKYKDWFTYCHMALDRFTYNGYRLPFYRNVVYPSMHGCSASALTPWSQLAVKEYSNIEDEIVSYVMSKPKTYNDYLDICKSNLKSLGHISYLSALDNYVLTPFEAEFFIWIIAKKCKDKAVGILDIKKTTSLL